MATKLFKGLLRIVVVTLISVLVFVLFLVRPFAFSTADNELSSKIAVEVLSLRNHVLKLSTEFSPRDHVSLANLTKAANYIHKEFKTHNSSVSYQEFEVQDDKYMNVLSSYGPANGPRVVIGAHYDVAGPFPGADDNASGVAGLLELGRLFATERPNIPVTLVAFSLEEPPFFATEHMGSAVHAKSLRKEGVEVRLMISLEMIGYFSDKPGSQMYPSALLKFLYPDKGNFIAIVDGLNFNLNSVALKNSFRSCSILPAVSINAPPLVPGIDFSDHRNYWFEGFPALMVTDTAFLRNHAYHTKDDGIEALNFEMMAEVVKGVYCYVQALR